MSEVFLDRFVGLMNFIYLCVQSKSSSLVLCRDFKHAQNFWPLETLRNIILISNTECWFTFSEWTKLTNNRPPPPPAAAPQLTEADRPYHDVSKWTGCCSSTTPINPEPYQREPAESKPPPSRPACIHTAGPPSLPAHRRRHWGGGGGWDCMTEMKRWKESYLCFCDLIILSSSHRAHFQEWFKQRLFPVTSGSCCSDDDDGSEYKTPADYIIIVPINQPGPCPLISFRALVGNFLFCLDHQRLLWFFNTSFMADFSAYIDRDIPIN